MSGVYNGWLVTGAAGWYSIAKQWDIGLTISSTYGDSAYSDKYFGVDTVDAIQRPCRDTPRAPASGMFPRRRSSFIT